MGGGGAIQPSGRRAVNSDQSEVLPKADIGSGGGHVGFVPIGDLVTPSDTRTTAPPSRPHLAAANWAGMVKDLDNDE